MSLLARLKAVFGSAPAAPVQTPRREAPSSTPKVKKPVVQEAVTDRHSVMLSRHTTAIAPGLVCHELIGSGSQISRLPDDLVVRDRLVLVNCNDLRELPTELVVPSVDLSGCKRLERLPAKMHVSFLNLGGCDGIQALPEDFQITGGILNLTGCTQLETLPDNMGEVAGLNLTGCHRITALPEGLKVTSWMDITGTKIKEIPAAYAGVGLRRGRAVISVEEALAA